MTKGELVKKLGKYNDDMDVVSTGAYKGTDGYSCPDVALEELYIYRDNDEIIYTGVEFSHKDWQFLGKKAVCVIY